MGNELILGDNKIDLTGVDIEAIIKAVNKLKNPRKTRKNTDEYVHLINVGWNDAKGLVFNFDNGNSFFYNFAEKILCHEDGTPFLPAHFSKVNLQTVKDYDQKLWLNLANKTMDGKAKRFFELLHCWADNRCGRDMTIRCRMAIFMGNTKVAPDKYEGQNILTNFESIVRAPALDSYSAFEILQMSKRCKDKIEGTSNASTLLKQCVSTWFTEHATEVTAPGYQVSYQRWSNMGYTYDEPTPLSNFRENYTVFKESSLSHVFEYCWTKHKKPLLDIDTIKELMDAGHEYKRLIDYLMVDMGNQGFVVNCDNGQHSTFSEYRDYVRMNIEMKVDYDKYPRYLATAHDITNMNYKIWQGKKLQQPFDSSLIEEYQKFDYKAPYNSEYEIVLPTSPSDIIREGNSQNHCVGSYVPRVFAKETFVVFMRSKKEPNKSLITVEVSPQGEIRQARGNHNRRLLPVEQEFIDAYQKSLSNLLIAQ